MQPITITTRPLRIALVGNALFSTFSGVLLLVFPKSIAAFLGIGTPMLLAGIGVALLLFAADLVHQATRRRMRTWRTLYAVAGDGLWVAGTLVLLLGFPAVFSGPGKVLLLVVGGIVATFGVLQFRGAGLAHRISGTGRYRHCVAVSAPVDADALWRVVSDLGGISAYFPALRSSFLRGGQPPGVGAVRQCEDLRGKRWAEECTRFDPAKRRVELKFLCDEPGFPYPASEMMGGWEILGEPDGASEVRVWWELKPRPAALAPLLMPLLGLKADMDFPKLIAAMASGIGGPAPALLPRRHGLIPRIC